MKIELYEEKEEPILNEDHFYEVWRNNQCEELEQELFRVLEAFYNRKGYYKGCRDKIIQHSKSFLDHWRIGENKK